MDAPTTEAALADVGTRRSLDFFAEILKSKVS